MAGKVQPQRFSRWLMTGVAAVSLVAFGQAQPGWAQAVGTLKCAAALTLVAQHPGVEAPSVVTDVLAQWQNMDRQTMATGHAAIAAQMLSSPAILDLLARHCEDNPGQSLQLAAAQVYLRARAAIEGF